MNVFILKEVFYLSVVLVIHEEGCPSQFDPVKPEKDAQFVLRSRLSAWVDFIVSFLRIERGLLKGYKRSEESLCKEVFIYHLHRLPYN